MVLKTRADAFLEFVPILQAAASIELFNELKKKPTSADLKMSDVHDVCGFEVTRMKFS